MHLFLSTQQFPFKQVWWSKDDEKKVMLTPHNVDQGLIASTNSCPFHNGMHLDFDCLVDWLMAKINAFTSMITPDRWNDLTTSLGRFVEKCSIIWPNDAEMVGKTTDLCGLSQKCLLVVKHACTWLEGEENTQKHQGGIPRFSLELQRLGH